MFNWFKRKPIPSPLVLILDLDDAAFVKAIHSVTESGRPNAWAMCVVAYETLLPIMEISFEFARSIGDKTAPADLDGYIRLLAERLEENKDEVKRRRIGWLFQAALILRATRKAETNSVLLPEVAAIWIALVRGGSVLHAAIKHNVLWSDLEKSFFSHINDEKSGMDYVLNLLAPKFVREHPSVEAFAVEHVLYISPF